MNQRGESADDLALQQNGFKLIAHHWRWRFDELDLIAREKQSWYSLKFGPVQGPNLAVRQTALRRQTHRAAHTTRHCLAALPRVPVCRSDTVLISGNGTIEWIKNTFEE